MSYNGVYVYSPRWLWQWTEPWATTPGLQKLHNREALSTQGSPTRSSPWVVSPFSLENSLYKGQDACATSANRRVAWSCADKGLPTTTKTVLWATPAERFLPHPMQATSFPKTPKYISSGNLQTFQAAKILKNMPQKPIYRRLEDKNRWKKLFFVENFVYCTWHIRIHNL